MQQEGEQRGEGSSPQHSGNDSGQPRTTGPLASCPDHGPRPRAVCGCPDCAAAMTAYLLRTGATRALLAQQGKHVPPLPHDADRFGLGDECSSCSGNGVLDCTDCSATGLGDSWSDSSSCSTCRGEGTDGECVDCQGEGVVLLRRCDQCQHLVPPDSLSADAHLAAARGWSTMALVCDSCVDCSECLSWVHADVVDEAGRCWACQRKAAVFGPPSVALLPERAASFLRDERGLETVEVAVLAGLIVAGLVAVIALIAVGVMKALRTLRGEIDPGR